MRQAKMQLEQNREYLRVMMNNLRKNLESDQSTRGIF